MCLATGMGLLLHDTYTTCLGYDQGEVCKVQIAAWYAPFYFHRPARPSWATTAVHTRAGQQGGVRVMYTGHIRGMFACHTSVMVVAEYLPPEVNTLFLHARSSRHMCSLFWCR